MLFWPALMQVYVSFEDYWSSVMRLENALSEVGFEPTPGEPDCDLNAAP